MLAGRPPASSASASFRAAMRAANSAYTGRPSGAADCPAVSQVHTTSDCSLKGLGLPLTSMLPAHIPDSWGLVAMLQGKLQMPDSLPQVVCRALRCTTG